MVDDRHLHGIDPGRPCSIWSRCDCYTWTRCDRLRYRRDPDHVGVAGIRSQTHLGPCGWRPGFRHGPGTGMSDELPVAVVRTRADRRLRISLIWAIPLV